MCPSAAARRFGSAVGSAAWIVAGSASERLSQVVDFLIEHHRADGQPLLCGKVQFQWRWLACVDVGGCCRDNLPPLLWVQLVWRSEGVGHVVLVNAH